MLDIVDRRRQRALVGGDDSARHLIGRHALVLPGHADDRNVDAREDVHRHAQGGKAADQKNQQRRNDERIRPAQRDADYGEQAASLKPEGQAFISIAACLVSVEMMSLLAPQSTLYNRLYEYILYN